MAEALYKTPARRRATAAPQRRDGAGTSGNGAATGARRRRRRHRRRVQRSEVRRSHAHERTPLFDDRLGPKTEAGEAVIDERPRQRLARRAARRGQSQRRRELQQVLAARWPISTTTRSASSATSSRSSRRAGRTLLRTFLAGARQPRARAAIRCAAARRCAAASSDAQRLRGGARGRRREGHRRSRASRSIRASPKRSAPRPRRDVADDTVVEAPRRATRMGDDVLRPAQVIVAKSE